MTGKDDEAFFQQIEQDFAGPVPNTFRGHPALNMWKLPVTSNSAILAPEHPSECGVLIEYNGDTKIMRMGVLLAQFNLFDVIEQYRAQPNA